MNASDQSRAIEGKTSRTAAGVLTPRVLVVDDTRAIHEDFRKILIPNRNKALAEAHAALFNAPSVLPRELRFELDSAYQGDQALRLVHDAMAEGRPYAVAFVDVRMPPGWDGIETISKLWRADPDLQVVICTAYSDYSWDELARRLGESDSLVILKKPFDNIEVLQLTDALAKKWLLAKELKQRLHNLDQLVYQRTQQLQEANERLSRDIAERRRTETHLLRLNRLYSVLSQINEVIVRASSLASLCKDTCRILVEHGLFRMAWFGKVLPENHRIEPLVHWGHEGGFLTEVALSAVADRPYSGGPIGVAVRENRIVVCNDIASDAMTSLWCQPAIVRGYRSLAAFPLTIGSKTIGVFCIFSSEAGFFNDEENQLLQRLSADLSFAVEFLEQGQQLRLQGTALESAANSILITDREGTILWHNAAFTQLTGYTTQDTAGKKPNLLKSGKHEAAFYQRLWNTIVAGQVWRGEVVNKRKDGRLFAEEMTITPVCADDGEVQHYVAIKQDITERKQAELRLAAFSALGQRLGSAQTAKAAALVIVEVADQLLGWDSCICDLYSASTGLVQPVLAVDIVAGKRVECDIKQSHHAPSGLARRALQEGGQLVLRDQLQQARPDGLPFGDLNRFSASILYVPIRNGSNVTGLLSIQSYTPKAYDQESLHTLEALADHCGGALERIQTVEALRRAQERLNHLLGQSAAMIYSLKPNRSADSLSWISENVTDLLGFTPGEACQPGWWAGHVHPDDREKLIAGDPQLFADNHRISEYRFQHKDGGYRWLRDDQRLVRQAEGQPEEIVGTWLDITKRKELEQQLRQSQKMEAIGQLAGGVAHDFNNMLTVIRGHTELLLMNPAALGENAVDSLKQVVAAADRATSLTRQLLTFSRKQIMQFRPLALDDAIGNLTKMLKWIIGEHVHFECSHGTRLPLIQADAGMIEQVLVNLVVNARDAMPQGGTLTISTEKVTVDQAYVQTHPEARLGEFACLVVSDTGTGIAPEHQGRIFEPFFTTKEVGKGTGLGLATVYGIVTQHGGWIEVTSQVNRGSTFRVYLPAIDTPTPTPEASQAELIPQRGTETILLVEDDEAVRALNRRLLEYFGYQVREARSGWEALALWRKELAHIDLLLTDVVMPNGITGPELARRFRLLRPELKVILLSGYGGEALGNGDGFVEDSRTRLLQKPCQWYNLLKELRQTLDGAPRSSLTSQRL